MKKAYFPKERTTTPFNNNYDFPITNAIFLGEIRHVYRNFLRFFEGSCREIVGALFGSNNKEGATAISPLLRCSQKGSHPRPNKGNEM